MQGSLNDPPLVVRRSARSLFWGLLLSLTFVILAILFIARPFGWWSNPKYADVSGAYAILVIFGLMTWISVKALFRTPELAINPAGIEFRGLYWTRRFAWRDITNIRAYQPGFTIGRIYVGFDFAPHYKPGFAWVRRLTRAFVNVDCSFADGWEVDSETLAQILNQAKARWGT